MVTRPTSSEARRDEGGENLADKDLHTKLFIATS